LLGGSQISCNLPSSARRQRWRLHHACSAILRENAERLRDTAAQLDRFHLSNADEPDFSFRAIDRVDAL
jgi:hypothetical protein